jgi:hypothetical protein
MVEFHWTVKNLIRQPDFGDSTLRGQRSFIVLMRHSFFDQVVVGTPDKGESLKSFTSDGNFNSCLS